MRGRLGFIESPGRRLFFENSVLVALVSSVSGRCFVFVCPVPPNPGNPRHWGPLIDAPLLAESQGVCRIELGGLEVSIRILPPDIARETLERLGDPWDTVEFSPREQSAFDIEKQEQVEALRDDFRGPFSRKGET